MGCITDAMCIPSVLNHGVLDYLHFPSTTLPDFARVTCPISPESKGNVLRAVPTTPCRIQGQLSLSKLEQLRSN